MSSTWSWLSWATSGRVSYDVVSKDGASSTAWSVSGSATEKWWRSCRGGWWRSPSQQRPFNQELQCLYNKLAPCSMLSRYLMYSKSLQNAWQDTAGLQRYTLWQAILLYHKDMNIVSIFSSVEGKGASRSARQLHSDSRGRQTTASVSR